MGVSVRHNSRLAALVALAAAVMTVAWFSRALQTGAWMDWLWCVVVAGVGLLQLLVVRDGRAPLMVADDQGVRVRRGQTWSGLRWQDIEHVEVQSPASWLRDGHIVVHPRVVSREEELLREAQADVDGAHEPVPSPTEAYVVPLAHTTKLEFDGMTGDLVSDLDALASGRVPVLVLTRIEPESPEKASRSAKPAKALKAARQEEVEEPAEPAEPGEPGEPDPQPLAQPEEPVQVEFAERVQPEQGLEEGAPVEKLARVRNARGRWSRMLARLGVVEPAGAAGQGTAPDVDPDTDQGAGQGAVEDAADQDEPTFEPVDPSRAARPAARSEVLRDSVRMLPTPPAIPSQRSGNAPVVVAGVDDLVISEPKPVKDALIGPLIAAARNRARLSIDTLSERTRIRPHVLECIEVDDFEACGGDFYARGHLRTLARVFGLDPQQLLDLYDDHYAKAEIQARQVFEAELATGIGGGVRTAHTGPRWSLLAACVLALAGVWGVARVFNDTPQELVSPTPNVVDAAGLAKADPAATPKMTLATLEVSSEDASPQVVIRDRDGRILWAGKLAEGQRQQVIGLAPFDVTASNGGAVKVSYLNKKKVTVGNSDAAASKQFG